MRKKIVKGCIFLMLLCLAGCGEAGESKTEEAVVTEEEMAEKEEEVSEDIDADLEAENSETEAEETTEEKQTATVSDQLSDDIYSFQIQVGEDIFQIPTTYQDFVDKGYVCSEPDKEELDPGLYLVRQEFVKGGITLFVGIINMTEEVQPIENCSAVSIGVDQFYVEKTGDDYPQIILPKGIQLAVSSVDDIIAAYGEPDETYEGDYTSLLYRKDFYQQLEFWVDLEQNALCSIDMENIPE
ncbi:MAG: hypothetical protein K2L07_01965 [Lachnospiraceae bacterium]|nr:hypothetical protein [Lachnospiraceae bacterium]